VTRAAVGGTLMDEAVNRTTSWTAAVLACLAWACAGVDNPEWDGRDAPDLADPVDSDAPGDAVDAADTDARTDPDLSDAADGEDEEIAPPFTCTAADTSSPVLDGVLVYDPADPHPGDTVTVVVRSQSLDRPEAPAMVLEERSAGGTRTWNAGTVAGGRAVYYYAVSNVEPGDHCLVGKIDGADEISGKFTVTPRPAGPPRCEGGVFKVTTNHLWTCGEQPEWGNEVRIEVYGADGNPMPGVTVRIKWPDTTQRPIYNDTDPPDPSEIPETVETGSDGVFAGFNYWPTNVNGYMVFNLSVDGCASDTATEITTGWWETDNDGCRFCDPGYTNRNVWGHWSHTVIFTLDPDATQACVVPVDHAGQQGCRIEHIHHDPDHMACWDVP
jgi:hypothetical protein